MYKELPPGVILQQVYSDFMGYLLKHTQTFFEDRLIDGKKIWERYKHTMEIVITHPSGWGAHEQTFLRAAAIRAGITSPDQASARIQFVTEVEASIYYCTYRSNPRNRPQVNVPN